MKAEIASLALAILVAGALAWPVRAADRPGEFTHYVMALSWNASWCAIEGDAMKARQCDPRRNYGFTLHGLWPQHEDGWPEFCRTPERDPSRAMTAEMADIMGSSGLAWHQWKKHGRCSGLSARAYFALARRAYGTIRRPAILRKLDKSIRVAPEVIETAFIEANPGLGPDEIAVTCRDGMLHEVRICLTKELAPRACAPEVARGCRARTVTMPPMR